MPGEGSGNPLQCSCLENPMDRGAWWAMVHGVAEWDMTGVTKQALLDDRLCLPYLIRISRPTANLSC